ncbi:Facilitated trehalose transporter Tret1 [Orchesella cincta]|uniref:Facilitated trehalose transporter Tret1 n=1 Tax=Orchesella cincta TaxID=48709 RepID=A0A1D2MW22_ORCCI|nr:Facilitated trehalose transporter Tret1 [Orchesella cincta]
MCPDPLIIPKLDENLPPIVPTLWKCRRQVYGSIVCTLGVFSTGCVFGWASPGIEDMINDGVEFDEATMASLFIVGSLVSGPISGYSMLKIGRKYAMLLFGIIFSLGWVLMGCAKLVLSSSNMGAVTMMYIGRFVTGFAGAACLAISPIYIKEMCCEELRSKMGGMVPLQLIVGFLYTFVMGSFLSWYALSFVCLIFPILLTILMIWMPESPRQEINTLSDFNSNLIGEYIYINASRLHCLVRYLIKKGRYQEGEQSIHWYYRGFKFEEGERVFRHLKMAIDYIKDPTKVKHAAKRQAEDNVEFKSRAVLRPLVVSALLIFFQQASGISFISTYTTDIFKASGDLVSPKVGTILVGLSLTIFIIITVFFLDDYGRKPILQIGTLIEGLCLFALGTFFILKEKGSSAVEYMRWVPVVSAVTFVAAYALGMEISNTITNTTYWLTAFIVTASLPALRNSVGYHFCCFFYGTFCFISYFFVTFCIYETKGKSTEEIMNHYRGSVYKEEDETGNDKHSYSLGARHAKSFGSLGPAKKQSHHAAGEGRNSILSTDTGSSDVNVLFETRESV